jgi:hypothetical protein
VQAEVDGALAEHWLAAEQRGGEDRRADGEERGGA